MTLLDFDKVYRPETLVLDGYGVNSGRQLGDTVVSVSIRNRLALQSGLVFDNRDVRLRQQTARGIRDGAAQSAAIHLRGTETGKEKHRAESDRNAKASNRGKASSEWTLLLLTVHGSPRETTDWMLKL